MEDFENYRKMIDALVRFNASRFHVDYDDLYSYADEMYVWCLRHFDGSKKTKFSTYLCMQMKARLVDEAKRLRKTVLYSDFDSPDDELSFEENIPSRKSVTGVVASILDAASGLSYEAKLILKYLIDFSWCENRLVPPNMTSVRKALGLTRVAVESAWAELSKFWQEKGWKVA